MKKENINKGRLESIKWGIRLFVKAKKGLFHLLMGIIIIVGELALMFAFGIISF